MSDLMTFIGGAAVGALVTYVSKNEEARKAVEHFIDSTGDAFTAYVRRITPGRQEAAEELSKEQAAEPVKKTARSRKVPKAANKAAVENSIH